MAGENFRIERDSMGEVKVPSEAYYGAQTQRAVENFPVSGIGFPRQFIRVLDDPGWVSGRWISPKAGDRLQKAAKLAQRAMASGQTIRELAQQEKVLGDDELAKILDPWRMTQPGIED